MTFLNKICLLFLFIMILTVISCDKKNPTEPANYFSNLLVIVQDESEKPIKDILVGTNPSTHKRMTNDEGKALLEQIPAGKYQVELSHPDIPLFYRDVELIKNQTLETKFVIASKVNIYVVIHDNFGRPVIDAEVRTYPPTKKSATDENGRALFENVPVRQYTFIIGRGKNTIRISYRKLVVRNGVLQDIKIVLGSQPPLVNIISPQSFNVQNMSNIHLIGDGFDFEDGSLPDNSLTWYSDIDGKLGTGRDLTVDYLSLGTNKITLVGIDSNGNQNEVSIFLFLYFLDEKSFLPLAWRGYWKYKYSNPDFSVVSDDGDTEYWSISDLEVYINDVNSRTCLMHYTITRGDTIEYCHYTLMDYFQTDVENLYVEKTSEELIIYKDEDYSFSYEIMRLESVYTPKYLIVKNQMDPGVESHFENTVFADVTWYYENATHGSKTYEESLVFETSVAIGRSEIIDTELGTFEAIPYTIYNGDSVKKWWLAKGVGMLRLEYYFAGQPLTAILYDTNIFEIIEESFEKRAVTNSFHTTGPQIRKKFASPPNTFERTREMCMFLRDLCPR